MQFQVHCMTVVNSSILFLLSFSFILVHWFKYFQFFCYYIFISFLLRLFFLILLCSFMSSFFSFINGFSFLFLCANYNLFLVISFNVKSATFLHSIPVSSCSSLFGLLPTSMSDGHTNIFPCNNASVFYWSVSIFNFYLSEKNAWCAL